MVAALLAIPFLLAGCAAQPYVTQPAESNNHTYPERRPELQEYQDAWRFIRRPDTFHLLYRTYGSDPKYGGNGTCIRGRLVSVNGTEKTAIRSMEYMDHKGGMHAFNTTYKAVRSPGYTTYNILNATFTEDPRPHPPPYPFPVAFYDKDRCAVVRVPHMDRGGVVGMPRAGNGTEYACDLWVAEKTLLKGTATPALSCCAFAYDLLCGTTKYQVYDPAICKFQDQEQGVPTTEAAEE